jgi:excisionase family DNA binding protein
MKPTQTPSEPPNFSDDRLAVSISETGRLLGIGRTTTYGLINQGILKTIKVGRRRPVLVSSIRALASAND